MKNYVIKLPLIDQVPNLTWSHRLDEHSGHRNKVFQHFLHFYVLFKSMPNHVDNIIVTSYYDLMINLMTISFS